MEQATKTEYRRLAEHFYRSRLDGQPPSPKRLADALKACAGDYRPDYWRRLRKALEVDQRAKGYRDAADRIAGTKNPVTVTGSGQKAKARQRRCRRVSDADHRALLADAERRGDARMKSALILSEHTGIRPAELPHVFASSDGKFISIRGVKKSHDGQRGADRDIELDDAAAAEVQRIAGDIPCDHSEVRGVQVRLQNTVQRLFPRRKAKPSLYSYRHQVGSDLKASGMDRKKIAYVMGHRGTKSVDKYGNARMARTRRGIVPELMADLSGIKEDHQPGYSQQSKPAKPRLTPGLSRSSTPGMSM